MYLDELPDIHDVQFTFGRRHKDARAKNYVIYCRESDERGDRNTSVPEQLKQAQHLAERDGLHVLHIVTERISAREYNRPKFNNLLRAIKGEDRLIDLPKSKWKLGRPDGIIAWHPDRLARNMRDAGEIIELLDNAGIVDMQFVMYSFHNDSSGKEHLAMEFARAKGYSDHLQDNVLRGLIGQETKGKATRPISHAFDVIRKEDENHPDHLKIVPSKWHRHWRDAYRWKLEGKTNKEIAELLIEDGYRPVYKRKGRWIPVKVDDNHVGEQLAKPLHCGWLATESGKEPRKADLNAIYPLFYGERFPVVVTLQEFKQVNPRLFSDTGKKLQIRSRRSEYPLASNKVLCGERCKLKQLATMTPNSPRSGGGSLSPRFTCQRCKPQHSIGMQDVYDAIEEKLKDVKITEREHKMLVVTEWHEYQKEREEIEDEERQLATMKGQNKQEIEDSRERINEMKYGKNKASHAEIATEKQKLARLEEARKSLLKREEKLGDRSMALYQDLDAFLELAKNGSAWWRKAIEEQKRALADILVSNVIVEGNKVASVSLNEPFKGWSLRGKSSDGRDDRTRTCDL